MYVTMALEYERKCTLLCMLDQTRKTPLLSQHHDEGTPICIAALENYPYLAYLQKKIWLRHPYPTPPSYRNFWSGEGTLRSAHRANRHKNTSEGPRCRVFVICLPGECQRATAALPDFRM
jgi:hypothetical protein